MTELRFSVHGPRWLRLDLIIKNSVHAMGLDCEVERETSWLREHIRATIRGDDCLVDSLEAVLDKTIDDYNGRASEWNTQ